MIHAENLRKSYGDLVAVAGVSFELRSGETLGLLGPNGAGKSTTINMLLGALEPDSGSISVAGAAISGSAALRAELGAAPQSLAIYEELSAEENLRFFAGLYGLRGAELTARVEAALELSELTDRRGSRVKTFSGGMKRRLNLACAMAHDPRALLLDEPTVGVDPQSRNLIFERIEELKAAGRTILYTTHYMEEAARLCDRVAIMDHGKILDTGSVEELIQRHGGASVVEAELSERPENPERLPGVLDGLHLRIDTERPLEVVAELSAAGLRFSSLKVERADLESVFLNLTGRSLRD